jgi:FeS assembly SUF system regulator
MRLSSLADYAVVTMCAASRHCGAGNAGRAGAGAARISAGELAQETGLPLPTVQKLVSQLVRGGLLHSARGAGGGLRLARPAAAISLADIVEAVEGPIALTSCVEGARQDCALEASCAVRPHWSVVNEALRGVLAEVPLTRLASAPAHEHTNMELPA